MQQQICAVRSESEGFGQVCNTVADFRYSIMTRPPAKGSLGQLDNKEKSEQTQLASLHSCR